MSSNDAGETAARPPTSPDPGPAQKAPKPPKPRKVEKRRKGRKG